MKFRFRHNKSYIDQASSVRVVEVWPRSNAKKKETGENPAILTSLLVKTYLLGCPQAQSWVFGRRCQKVVIRGRENKRIWYVETMFSQMVS